MWIPPTYKPNGLVSPSLFKQFKNDYNALTHFPQSSGELHYVVIDAYNFRKVYTVFNTGSIMNNIIGARLTFVSLQS